MGEEIETKCHFLTHQMEELSVKCNKLKQNEYNFKLNEQALIEKYSQNYNEFNSEYECLQNKVQIMENSNNCLTDKCEEYEHVIAQYKEESNTINIKYKMLQCEEKKNRQTNESEMVCKLKQEIDAMQQQLFEGSNIRRELREFISKYQADGQKKLNKNFQ